jgi:hypothetical protein
MDAEAALITATPSEQCVGMAGLQLLGLYISHPLHAGKTKILLKACLQLPIVGIVERNIVFDNLFNKGVAAARTFAKCGIVGI